MVVVTEVLVLASPAPADRVLPARRRQAVWPFDPVDVAELQQGLSPVLRRAQRLEQLCPPWHPGAALHGRQDPVRPGTAAGAGPEDQADRLIHGAADLDQIEHA